MGAFVFKKTEDSRKGGSSGATDNRGSDLVHRAGRGALIPGDARGQRVRQLPCRLIYEAGKGRTWLRCSRCPAWP